MFIWFIDYTLEECKNKNKIKTLYNNLYSFLYSFLYMSSGIGRKYTPNLNAWYKCVGTCPDPNTYAYFKTFIVRNPDGTEVEEIRKVPVTPNWQRYSDLIRTSTFYTAGQSLKYANRSLNEYGSWAGAPTGYGQPPRNQFN